MLFQVRNLKKHFKITGGFLKREVGRVYAVNGVDLHLSEGETLGLVGESGCGKSTLGRTIMGLYEKTEGDIIFEGKEISNLSHKERKRVLRDIQMVFQDPFGSLDPRMTVREILLEPFKIHGILNREERKKALNDLLQDVGLSRDSLSRYPHEFSGGQRQRIGIARAISLNPKIIIADEPVSALDVSIQSQILNLFVNLQKKRKLTMIFIAHNLAVVKHVSDRVAVMYLGKIVEVGKSADIIDSPKHPYTRALISAIPDIDVESKNERILLEGDLPSPSNPPLGCAFHPRCTFRTEICERMVPELLECDSNKNRLVACHLVNRREKC